MLAILIAAHSNPKHFGALLRALESPEVHSFVHIDKKVDIVPFENFASKNTTFIRNRVKVFWGGWSQVQATLNLIAAAISDERQFTHFALISGADYPVTIISDLYEFVKKGGDFINSTPFPNENLGKKKTRLTKYFFEGGERAVGTKARFLRLLTRLARKLPDRSISKISIPLYAGSSWWVLSRSSAFLAKGMGEVGQPLRRLLRFSLCPDELFFQTAASANSNERISGPAVTFADWSRRASGPDELNLNHVAHLRENGYEMDLGYGPTSIFFVRKCSDNSVDVRREIDALCGRIVESNADDTKVNL